MVEPKRLEHKWGDPIAGQGPPPRCLQCGIDRNPYTLMAEARQSECQPAPLVNPYLNHRRRDYSPFEA